MESDITQSPLFYRLWEWVETRRKPLIVGAIVVAVVGLAVGFFFWHESQNETVANVALSKLATSPAPATVSAADFLKVAADYPHTDAGARALLLAGSRFYEAGKYADAQAQFDRYLREYRNGAFAGQASLGRAACLESLGKATEAMSAYKEIADHHSTDNVAPQARLGLGRIYEALGNYDLARMSYEQIARPDSFVGAEAALRLEELLNRMPAPAPAPTPGPAPVRLAPATNLPAIKLQKN